MHRKLLLVLPLFAACTYGFGASAEERVPAPQSDTLALSPSMKAPFTDFADLTYDDPRKQTSSVIEDDTGTTVQAYDMRPGKLVTSQSDKLRAEKKPRIDTIQVGAVERLKKRRFTLPLKLPNGLFN